MATTTITPTRPVRWNDAVRLVQNGEDPNRTADRLLDQLTDDELLWLLDGDTKVREIFKLPSRLRRGDGIRAGEIERLGIPGIRFADGPRGVTPGNSTAFPVTMARGATWDPELEREIGLAMGREGRALGANYSGAVCINLLRHPAWGRAQECYGEDPVLTGRMGAALAVGLRANVMACVKHFALNSMENSRFKVDVRADEHALHEVYLPHFKQVIDAGVESVMSSYNRVNGEWAGESSHLLDDILRKEWGFTGFVTSDWLWGIYDGVKSLKAGMEVEMPLHAIRARSLPKALKDGTISRDLILRAGRRIFSTMLKHEAQRDPQSPDESVVAGREHRALARRAASAAMVLLKNEPVNGTPVLPLDASTLRRVAVIGALATEPNMGDRGSSNAHPPTTSSPLDGIREALPGVVIDHVDGTDLDAAEKAAREADAAIVVVGMRYNDEGEYLINDKEDSLSVFGFPFTVGWVRRLASRFSPLSADKMASQGNGGDRARLSLRPEEEMLLLAVAAANPRTVPVLIGGSAITMERWKDHVPAILLGWYPGMEGGRALADVLIGAAEPTGRLPFAIPTDSAHLPHFELETDQIVYDSSWGQRKLDRDGHEAAFPFGFGLGYATFDVALDSVTAGENAGRATVRVRNTVGRAGATVIQVYAFDSDADRAVPQLIGFQRVVLPGGGEDVVDVELDLTPTLERGPQTQEWSRRSGSWAAVAVQASPAPSELAAAQPLFTNPAPSRRRPAASTKSEAPA